MKYNDLKVCSKEGCGWTYPAVMEKCPFCGDPYGVMLYYLIRRFGGQKLIAESRRIMEEKIK